MPVTIIRKRTCFCHISTRDAKESILITSYIVETDISDEKMSTNIIWDRVSSEINSTPVDGAHPLPHYSLFFVKQQGFYKRVELNYTFYTG